MVPQVFLAVIQQAYPHAIWEKDIDKYAALMNDWESADNNTRRQLSAKMLQEDPYTSDSYVRCYLLIQTEERQEDDRKSLSAVAEWFGVNLQAEIGKFVNNEIERTSKEYPINDMRRYELILQVQQENGWRSPRADAILGEYVSSLLSELHDYSPENIVHVVEDIDTFGEKYGYSADKEKGELTRAILKESGLKGAQTKGLSLAEARNNLERIKELDNVIAGLDFQEAIDTLKERIEKMEKKEEEERQRCIDEEEKKRLKIAREEEKRKIWLARVKEREEYRLASVEVLRPQQELALRLKGHLAVNPDFAVGVKADGTVVSAGVYGSVGYDILNWRNITAISASDRYAVGLRADGTVISVDNKNDVEGWRDIIAVSRGDGYTVGLRKNGTAVAIGYNHSGQCNVDNWSNIVAVSAGHFHTVGLKEDGTVIAVGTDMSGSCRVDRWKDILAVEVGNRHTVGLRAGGVVIAVGDNQYGQCNTKDWTDIIDIATGSFFTAGLRADGTVISVGCNDDGQCNTSDWKDIITIAAGASTILGLKADGTVVVAGALTTKQLTKPVKITEGNRQPTEIASISDWKLFKNVATLEKEEEETRAQKRVEDEVICNKLESERYRLQNELANLKGIFSGKRRKEIQDRLTEITTKLKALKY